MMKIVIFAIIIGCASAGVLNYGNYGYNVGGAGGYGHGHGAGVGGAYGGYGSAVVKVNQDANSYNFGVQTQAAGGNSFINQAAGFGGYGK